MGYQRDKYVRDCEQDEAARGPLITQFSSVLPCAFQTNQGCSQLKAESRVYSTEKKPFGITYDSAQVVDKVVLPAHL